MKDRLNSRPSRHDEGVFQSGLLSVNCPLNLTEPLLLMDFFTKSKKKEVKRKKKKENTSCYCWQHVIRSGDTEKMRFWADPRGMTQPHYVLDSKLDVM